MKEVVPSLAHFPHLLSSEQLVVGWVDRRLEHPVLPLLCVRFDGGLDEVLCRECPALRGSKDL